MTIYCEVISANSGPQNLPSRRFELGFFVIHSDKDQKPLAIERHASAAVRAVIKAIIERDEWAYIFPGSFGDKDDLASHVVISTKYEKSLQVLPEYLLPENSAQLPEDVFQLRSGREVMTVSDFILNAHTYMLEERTELCNRTVENYDFGERYIDYQGPWDTEGVRTARCSLRLAKKGSPETVEKVMKIGLGGTFGLTVKSVILEEPAHVAN